MNIFKKIYYKLFPKKEKLAMNRRNIKKELKKYSRNQLITMISVMGNELVLYKKKYGSI
jgi:hypothetical protein